MMICQFHWLIGCNKCSRWLQFPNNIKQLLTNFRDLSLGMPNAREQNFLITKSYIKLGIKFKKKKRHKPRIIKGNNYAVTQAVLTLQPCNKVTERQWFSRSLRFVPMGELNTPLLRSRKWRMGVKNRDSKNIEAKKVEEDEDLLHKMEEQKVISYVSKNLILQQEISYIGTC